MNELYNTQIMSARRHAAHVTKVLCELLHSLSIRSGYARVAGICHQFNALELIGGFVLSPNSASGRPQITMACLVNEQRRANALQQARAKAKQGKVS